ncbi:MAG: precorrin-8X methylmutase [Rhizobiales bacterium]|nr:precorrin-8X methylmutase [Hyphomicrobiales bacterium]
MIEYLRDPGEIYARSFAAIRAEARFDHLPPDAEPVAVRVIHACGMPDVVNNLAISGDFVAVARKALTNGAHILVDAEMVKHGIMPRLVPKGSQIVCMLNDPRARQLGIDNKTTRSAAAVELWKPMLAGNIAVIGNAPTALFRLLELIDEGAPKPAAIVAFPVGFVGAAESKEELIADSRGIPFATIRGRKGGSAMASAVINALLDTAP